MKYDWSKNTRAPIVTALAIALTLHLSPASASNFLTAGQFIYYPADERTIIVEAFWDMHSYFGQKIGGIVNAASNAEIARYERCVTPLTPDQLRQKFDDYLSAHPEAMSYALASDFAAMLAATCPP